MSLLPVRAGRKNDKPRRRRGRGLITSLATATALIGAGLTGGSVAAAQQNPYERGPAPTQQSVEAARGPFAIDQISVSRLSVRGFGGGTIYAPRDLSQGTFGAVAVSPGFTGTQETMAWYGPRLASQGFVVFTIDTNSLYDQPDSRGAQLLAALDYLTTSSAVRNRIDASRLGVMGHSMGGGGSLAAARSRPSLQAAIPLAPWHTTKNWSGNRTPTLVVGAQNDTIAPVSQHAEPFYNSLSASAEKAYLELRGAGHLVVNSPNTTIAKYSISWLKRFIDNDTRYEQFLCPPPPPDLAISEYRDTCPSSTALALAG